MKLSAENKKPFTEVSCLHSKQSFLGFKKHFLKLIFVNSAIEMAHIFQGQGLVARLLCGFPSRHLK